MNVVTKNFRVLQGVVFSGVIGWKNSDGSVKDLTGWGAKLTVSDGSSEVATLTEATGITLGSALPNISWSVVTTNWPAKRLDYSLVLYDASSTPIGFMEGTVQVESHPTTV